METLEKAYDILFTGALVVFSLCLVVCLARAIIGPRTGDRIVANNMAGTITIIMIAIFSVLLDQSYLTDVCTVYAMLSFVAVIVLSKIYMGVYTEQELKKASGKPNSEDGDGR